MQSAQLAHFKTHIQAKSRGVSRLAEKASTRISQLNIASGLSERRLYVLHHRVMRDGGRLGCYVIFQMVGVASPRPVRRHPAPHRLAQAATSADMIAGLALLNQATDRTGTSGMRAIRPFRAANRLVARHNRSTLEAMPQSVARGDARRQHQLLGRDPHGESQKNLGILTKSRSWRDYVRELS